MTEVNERPFPNMREVKEKSVTNMTEVKKNLFLIS